MPRNSRHIIVCVILDINTILSHRPTTLRPPARFKSPLPFLNRTAFIAFICIKQQQQQQQQEQQQQLHIAANHIKLKGTPQHNGKSLNNSYHLGTYRCVVVIIYPVVSCSASVNDTKITYCPCQTHIL